LFDRRICLRGKQTGRSGHKKGLFGEDLNISGDKKDIFDDQKDRFGDKNCLLWRRYVFFAVRKIVLVTKKIDAETRTVY
jgi:hypothetical protein